MAALTASKQINHTLLGTQATIVRRVAASRVIFAGAGLSYDAGGDVQPLVAGDGFAGVAAEFVDNSSGADGDADVLVYRDAILHNVAIAGLDGHDHIGDTVYMSNDNDMTLTVGSNTPAGKVENYDGVSGRGDVRIQAIELRSI